MKVDVRRAEEQRQEPWFCVGHHGCSGPVATHQSLAFVSLRRLACKEQRFDPWRLFDNSLARGVGTVCIWWAHATADGGRSLEANPGNGRIANLDSLLCDFALPNLFFITTVVANSYQQLLATSRNGLHPSSDGLLLVASLLLVANNLLECARIQFLLAAGGFVDK